MNRSITGTILWTCFAGMLGAALFFVKHEVKDLETKLASVNHDIVRNQEDIHVLNAEWSFLNDPVRLRDLAQRHLGMKQMGPTQVATLDTLNSQPFAGTTQTQYAAATSHTPTAAAKQPTTASAPSALPAPKPVIVMAQTAPATHPKPSDHHPRIAGGTGLAMVSTPGEAR